MCSGFLVVILFLGDSSKFKLANLEFEKLLGGATIGDCTLALSGAILYTLCCEAGGEDIGGLVGGCWCEPCV